MYCALFGLNAEKKLGKTGTFDYGRPFVFCLWLFLPNVSGKVHHRFFLCLLIKKSKVQKNKKVDLYYHVFDLHDSIVFQTFYL